ncbi:MAG: 4Fe-4S dicluster domain-containing protein [Hyphomicrobiaceae bacterium]
MTDLPDATATSTAAYLGEAAHRLADLCTACGACFSACPMAAHLDMHSADAKVVTDGLRKLARGEPGPDETVAWVRACGKSGQCIKACPEHDKGLDAMLLVRIARQQAINTTGQFASKPDPTAFPRVKVFARLQLTDEEQKRWL